MGKRGRGEGSISKLPSGSYRAEIWIGTDAQGEPIRVRKTFKAKKAAVEWLAEQQVLFARGELAAPSTVTVGEWFARWLEMKAGTVGTRTHEFYETYHRRLISPHLDKIILRELKPDAVAAWYAKLAAGGTSASERHKAGTTLRACIEDAARLGVLASNPAAKVRRPKVERKELPVFTLPQAQAFIAACVGHPGEVLFRFMLDSGCRPQEAFALRWEDVSEDAAEVRITRALERARGQKKEKPPKTAAGRRTILLGEPTAELLRGVREFRTPKPSDLVFPNSKGGWLDHCNVAHKWWKPILKKAGLPPVNPYCLRHTSATLLLEAGVGVKTVSVRLGHESIEITLKHYAHVLRSMQEEAARVAGVLFAHSHELPTDEK